jgi:hypothetical protein
MFYPSNIDSKVLATAAATWYQTLPISEVARAEDVCVG